MKPSSGLRSSGCRMWSESLNWHKTLSFIGGPMLIDTQLFSMLQRPLQEARIPKLKEIFLITWPCRAYPFTGVVNLRWRQRSVNKKNKNKMYQIHSEYAYERDVEMKISDLFSAIQCNRFFLYLSITTTYLVLNSKKFRIFPPLSYLPFCAVKMQNKYFNWWRPKTKDFYWVQRSYKAIIYFCVSWKYL